MWASVDAPHRRGRDLAAPMWVPPEHSHVRVIGREILEPGEQGEDVFAFPQFETRKVLPAVLSDERSQDDSPGASKERADRS